MASIFIVSWYPQGPKRRNLDMTVWVKPGSHTHTKHELRFPPQYHTSYKWGYHSAIKYKCGVRVLRPVRRRMTTLDKERWSYTSTPLWVFIAFSEENFTFTFGTCDFCYITCEPIGNQFLNFRQWIMSFPSRVSKFYWPMKIRALYFLE